MTLPGCRKDHADSDNGTVLYCVGEKLTIRVSVGETAAFSDVDAVVDRSVPAQALGRAKFAGIRATSSINDLIPAKLWKLIT